jgi:hypothetical protein
MEENFLDYGLGSSALFAPSYRNKEKIELD